MNNLEKTFSNIKTALYIIKTALHNKTNGSIHLSNLYKAFPLNKLEKKIAKFFKRKNENKNL